MDYSTLKTTLALYLKRDSLSALVPTFVSMAEARINRDLRIIEMETTVTESVSSGVSSFTLPTDFQELIRIEQETSSGRNPLERMTPLQMSVWHQNNTTDTPYYFAMIGTTVEIQPTPGEDIDLLVSYRARFSSLSADTDTNWLLTNNPQIYIYAAMLEATPFIHADERAQMWEKYYLAEKDLLNDLAEDQRWEGGPKQIRQLGTSTP